ncbi:hypothetical protein AB0H71_33655 [Nocardia sp. NPDC050697]|uniref:hypothetical protein n=1 Tax=Nocardia sp. NPDC050697 TaxID=3155158 RepID=UPI0033EACD90
MNTNSGGTMLADLGTAAIVFALVSGVYLAVHAVADVLGRQHQPRLTTARDWADALVLAVLDNAHRRRWIFVAAAIIAVPLSW